MKIKTYLVCLGILLADAQYVHSQSTLPPKLEPVITEAAAPGDPSKKIVTIVGNELNLKDGKRFGALYRGDGSIAKLVLDAEVIVITGAVKVPKAEVSILCRTLSFRDADGQIAGLSTEPGPQVGKPPAATEKENKARNGAPGFDAGNVTLFAEMIDAPEDRTRFILRGGKGQDAGEGRPGKAGQRLKPGSAEDAVSAGIPGRGGAAGRLYIPDVLKAFIDSHPSFMVSTGGSSGGAGADQKGGTGFPIPSGWFRNLSVKGGKDARAPVGEPPNPATQPKTFSAVPPEAEAFPPILQFLRSLKANYPTTCQRLAKGYLRRIDEWCVVNKVLEEDLNDETRAFRESLLDLVK